MHATHDWRRFSILARPRAPRQRGGSLKAIGRDFW
jgi:hypothetical protein